MNGNFARLTSLPGTTSVDLGSYSSTVIWGTGVGQGACAPSEAARSQAPKPVRGTVVLLRVTLLSLLIRAFPSVETKECRSGLQKQFRTEVPSTDRERRGGSTAGAPGRLPSTGISPSGGASPCPSGRTSSPSSRS